MSDSESETEPLDWELRAGAALASLLCSGLMLAYQHGGREYLFEWEREALRLLLELWEMRPDAMLNAWTMDFARLNRDMILSKGGVIDWDLRAADEAAQSAVAPGD